MFGLLYFMEKLINGIVWCAKKCSNTTDKDGLFYYQQDGLHLTFIQTSGNSLINNFQIDGLVMQGQCTATSFTRFDSPIFYFGVSLKIDRMFHLHLLISLSWEIECTLQLQKWCLKYWFKFGKTKNDFSGNHIKSKLLFIENMMYFALKLHFNWFYRLIEYISTYLKDF